MNSILLDIAIIVSGVIGYFISIALITTTFYKSRANNYLSLSLFLLTTITLSVWFNIKNTRLSFLDNPVLEYLSGITLFTYFLIQINHQYLKKPWYKWLYLPFTAVLVIETIIGNYDLGFNDILMDIMDHASFVYNAFFIFWGRKLLVNASKISEAKKHWLLRLNLFMVCIMLIWLLASIELLLFHSEYTTNILRIVASLLSWWILYYGIFKLQLIVQKDEIHDYLVSKNIKGAQVKKKINDATASKIMSQLYALMEQEELYKNPLLSRLDLANRLDTSEGYLSKIVNQEINKSTIQFVNDYRIEAAKALLHNSVFDKYSIEAIGMEAGFKSKSAFYKTFNTHLGTSPGAYRKQQNMS